MSRRTDTALVLCGLLAGCLQTQEQVDPAYLPVSLQPPYSTLPEVPPDTPIEHGVPIKLDMHQQEAVVAAVRKWMKTPGTATFGAMSGVQLRQGPIAVCGEVDGRNSTGLYAGMARYVGVLLGPPKEPDFVVVSIAQNGKPRAEIESICQKSGIFLGESNSLH